MLRVTADTNIYISALQFGGQPLRLLELAREENIVLTTSAAILQEIAEVLRDKFQRSERDIEQAMQHLSHIAETVIPSERVNAVADDPDDNAIIECALAAEANVIVSGDRHLLSLGQFGGIQIMKVADFLEAVIGTATEKL
ncbi:MAG: putative toxin-antitoxin system toxin component, PIN family [Bryobacteraceae bacterium]